MGGRTAAAKHHVEYVLRSGFATAVLAMVCMLSHLRLFLEAQVGRVRECQTHRQQATGDVGQCAQPANVRRRIDRSVLGYPRLTGMHRPRPPLVRTNTTWRVNNGPPECAEVQTQHHTATPAQRVHCIVYALWKASAALGAAFLSGCNFKASCSHLCELPCLMHTRTHARQHAPSCTPCEWHLRLHRVQGQAPSSGPCTSECGQPSPSAQQ